jgi:hypothetical protein
VQVVYYQDLGIMYEFFSLNELKSATRNFHMLNCIGHGGFGAVYKVRLQFVIFECSFLSLFFLYGLSDICHFYLSDHFKRLKNIVVNLSAKIE